VSYDFRDAVQDACAKVSGVHAGVVECALEQIARHLGAWDGERETKPGAVAALAGRVATSRRHSVDETTILLDGQRIGAVTGSWDGTCYTAKLEWDRPK
jgi:hypothetical protein